MKFKTGDLIRNYITKQYVEFGIIVQDYGRTFRIMFFYPEKYELNFNKDYVNKTFRILDEKYIERRNKFEKEK